MTVSAANLTTTTTALTVLQQAAANTDQLTTQTQLNRIDALIQNRLKVQTAALENTPDAVVSNVAQQQITTLKSQVSTITATSSQFSINSGLLADLQSQLAALQTAAQNDDPSGFDTALTVANNDVSNLVVVTPTAPFQPDQVLPLKINGLGIGNSGSYDLSTPDGQTAAAAAISSAQTTVGQVFQNTSNNQLLATDVTNALSTQVNFLVSQQQQSQTADQTQTEAQVAQLTQRANDQEHLIELALGNTQTLSNQITLLETPVNPSTSPFSVLQSAIGETATTANQQSSSAIISLLA